MLRTRSALLTAAVGAAALVASGLVAPARAASPSSTTTVVYDSFQRPGGYTLADYNTKWFNPYGLGEMALTDTRSFARNHLTISAVPFRTAYDYSVFDHLKYIGISTTAFPVPTVGSVEISSTIKATTPGTDAVGRTITGTYTATGAPYSAHVREGQEAAAVMNVIDFSTGQLFDWFISGHRAFALIERLPSSVTDQPGSPTPPDSPSYVGRDKMYTQIIREVPVCPGTHAVAIRFSRDAAGIGHADYTLDGEAFAHVDHVGVPLDKQGVRWTGTYPSLGAGQELGSKINSLSIGHGLFSLLDAFPFQHPDSPELAVSIPTAQRAFGQGATGTFDAFRVKTKG